MIPTFLLNEDNTFVNDDESILDINPEGFINQGNLYNNLRSAIEWAISHDEDAIYCVCGSDVRYDFNIDHLNEVINDLAIEGIFSLYITASYKNSIVVNKDLITISNINSVSSFILLSPIFEHVLSLLNQMPDNLQISFSSFIELIIPNAFLLFQNRTFYAKPHKIFIISPFRNAVNYIEDYLASVTKQSFTNYQIILIDDCSTDGSIEKIPELPFVKKIINNERKFALKNIIDVLINEIIDDEDVICLVDADDMLSHKYVLNIINNTYKNNSILVTYGSIMYMGTHIRIGESYCEEEFNNLRNSDWKVSHLRTFKYKVFKQLLSQDKNLDCLRNDKGAIMNMPYDMALLFPLMELAGFENTQFIYTPTYKYRLHQNNDHNSNKAEQYEGELLVRSKSRLKQFF
ncbi:hypothetical protein SF1_42040 [Sphingobacterium faecium NBRC 15299]|uniref:glycosyltransferase family A protein n=1 Tax=Sphingobacterium faecium TaxID=34087 RepID=UPI000D3AA794|nr:glycosyltransferase family A protein [Sphingobacterium faecium]PTX06971.1 glycosyl transferase family 2 [Sphingobacterium faecium]GEM66222.1 hypothetical protein SF1_42040 [Sphingobacterium faecium NBRC 15299]